ncbi:hypothetical protein ARALYDRAFT_356399 [Arabidopsis lyrata subsp. lyrata]|uniref:Uncharacterized protein n=1 Tax=Arabidopsis lyrata subsp. lyrata TaxID=81972 RepID=D7MSN4_ARALL|nr:hypothetical protein ARALYDRAFT_356399 [Arabidopsis lyrata subsp. lyrata]
MAMEVVTPAPAQIPSERNIVLAPATTTTTATVENPQEEQDQVSNTKKPFLLLIFDASHGSQRERDRERAAGDKGKNSNNGLKPEQRRERDGKALQEKAVNKAAEAAAAGSSGGAGDLHAFCISLLEEIQTLKDRDLEKDRQLKYLMEQAPPPTICTNSTTGLSERAK